MKKSEVNYDVETYLLSWDMHGLEACINISDMDRQKTFDILRGVDNKSNPNQIANMIMLRAKFNSQRHYEIYAIDVDANVGQEDIKASFESDPQGMAELVRKRGRCLYSDRMQKNNIRIT